MSVTRLSRPAPNWARPVTLAVAAIAYAVLAYAAHNTFTPDKRFVSGPDVAGRKVQLYRPYFHQRGFAFALTHSTFMDEADTNDRPARSAVELYEDGRRLGPSHSSADDIATRGAGRFSHRSSDRGGGGLITFSSSDNSDPNTNGRSYWIVEPTIPSSSAGEPRAAR